MGPDLKHAFLDEPLTLSQMVEKFLAWNSCNTKI